MIAGRLHRNGSSYRVVVDYTAFARLAAAEALAGYPDLYCAEVRLFMLTVVDERDRQRWQRAAAHATRDELKDAAVEAARLILCAADRDPDPDRQEWAAEFRDTIRRYQAGDGNAFNDLALSKMLAAT